MDIYNFPPWSIATTDTKGLLIFRFPTKTLGLAAYKTIWITSRKSKAMTPFLSLKSEKSDLVHICARVCEHVCMCV